VKYTIAGILVVVAALLIWIIRTGTLADALLMIVAIVSVTFFASMGNLWNSLYPDSRTKTPSTPANSADREVITVSDPSRKS